MKKTICIAVLSFLFILNTSAQVVDESISGVQVGYLGVWLNNELSVSKNWALRSEIGYEAPLFSNIDFESKRLKFYKNQFPLFLPVISIEPRWYYNSSKRQGNSKNTFHNSGNYVSIAARYYPEILVYSPKGINEVDGGFFIVPSRGIRRNINYRWNIEIGAGIGVDVTKVRRSETNTGGTEDFEDILFNIHLRFGYKFGMKE